MTQVVDDVVAHGAREHREVLGAQMWRTHNRLVLGDEGDDRLDVRLLIAETPQRARHGLVDDGHRAAADELLRFDEGQVGFDAGRVGIEHEADRARGRQHRGLRVAHAGRGRELAHFVPCALRRAEQVGRDQLFVDVRGGLTMHVEHPQHVLAVLEVPGKGPHARRDACRGEVGLTGHERGERAGDRATGVGVVGQAERHEERAEVGETEAELAERPGGLADLVGRVIRVADQDLLGGEGDLDRRAERLDVEPIDAFTLVVQEPQQVEAREIAGAVVEAEILRTVLNDDAVDHVAVVAGLAQVVGELEAVFGALDETRCGAHRVGAAHARSDDASEHRPLGAQRESDLGREPLDAARGDAEVVRGALRVGHLGAIATRVHESAPAPIAHLVDGARNTKRAEEALHAAQQLDGHRAEPDVRALVVVANRAAVRVEQPTQERRGNGRRRLFDRPGHRLVDCGNRPHAERLEKPLELPTTDAQLHRAIGLLGRLG